MSHTHYLPINEHIIYQEREFQSVGDVFECAGPFLVLGHFQLDRADMRLRRSDQTWECLEATDFAWLLPPWSIFHYQCESLHIHSQVHIFRPGPALNTCAFQAPVLLPNPPKQPLPSSMPALQAWLSMFEKVQPRYRSATLSGKTRLLKAAIETSLGESISLREIAEKHHLNHTVAGRQFKSDFGMTPKQYQNRLRVICSIDHLLAGSGPIDAGFQAGFNDVTRYYQQFKKTVASSPAKYVAESKNAKTHHSI